MGTAVRIFLFVLAVGLSPGAASAGKYFPRYESDEGGLIEFFEGGFYVLDTTKQELSFYTCRKLSSLTNALHWGQCEGGEKFLFTLDPKHPETMKIGDVVYKECGIRRDKC